MDNSKGRYWDKPWSLVDGCTPCSPGCDHCWSASMAHRFYREHLTTTEGKFNGHVVARPDRIDLPLRTRKPTVFAVWNDILHDDVPMGFLYAALDRVSYYPQHTFLFLTKRAHNLGMIAHYLSVHGTMDNFYLGVTVCNQAEADAKIPELLKVPGKKWISYEPALGPVDFEMALEGFQPYNPDYTRRPAPIDCLICGGETGPGARPMHPDWVRSVRDQCAEAGVKFYLKSGLGKKKTYWTQDVQDWGNMTEELWAMLEDGHIGSYPLHRMLDGQVHDSLPWGNNDYMIVPMPCQNCGRTVLVRLPFVGCVFCSDCAGGRSVAYMFKTKEAGDESEG